MAGADRSRTASAAESSVDLPGSTSPTIAGGVDELRYGEILHGAVARLPGRLPDLVFLIVLPFLGPERVAARRERARGALASSRASGKP